MKFLKVVSVHVAFAVFTNADVILGNDCVSFVSHIKDAWCREVNCAPPYVLAGLCGHSTLSITPSTFFPLPSKSSTSPSSSSLKCVSLVSYISDNWCQDVNCALVYTQAGLCSEVRTKTDFVYSTVTDSSTTSSTAATKTYSVSSTSVDFSPFTTTPGSSTSFTSRTCVSLLSHISDKWCQEVDCAITYIQAGFCGEIAAETDSGSFSTTSLSTTAPAPETDRAYSTSTDFRTPTVATETPVTTDSSSSIEWDAPPFNNDGSLEGFPGLRFYGVPYIVQSEHNDETVWLCEPREKAAYNSSCGSLDLVPAEPIDGLLSCLAQCSTRVRCESVDYLTESGKCNLSNTLVKELNVGTPNENISGGDKKNAPKGVYMQKLPFFGPSIFSDIGAPGIVKGQGTYIWGGSYSDFQTCDDGTAHTMEEGLNLNECALECVNPLKPCHHFRHIENNCYLYPTYDDDWWRNESNRQNWYYNTDFEISGFTFLGDGISCSPSQLPPQGTNFIKGMRLCAQECGVKPTCTYFKYRVDGLCSLSLTTMAYGEYLRTNVVSSIILHTQKNELREYKYQREDMLCQGRETHAFTWESGDTESRASVCFPMAQENEWCFGSEAETRNFAYYPLNVYRTNHEHTPCAPGLMCKPEIIHTYRWGSTSWPNDNRDSSDPVDDNTCKAAAECLDDITSDYCGVDVRVKCYGGYDNRCSYYLTRAVDGVVIGCRLFAVAEDYYCVDPKLPVETPETVLCSSTFGNDVCKYYNKMYDTSSQGKQVRSLEEYVSVCCDDIMR